MSMMFVWPTCMMKTFMESRPNDAERKLEILRCAQNDSSFPFQSTNTNSFAASNTCAYFSHGESGLTGGAEGPANSMLALHSIPSPATAGLLAGEPSARMIGVHVNPSE